MAEDDCIDTLRRDKIKNMTEGTLELYLRAAERGDSEAQYYLGVVFENGFGVTKNEQEALRWYQLAADQGHAEAQMNLGFLFAKRNSGLRNEAKALEWFHKVAEHGNRIAQELLAKAYGKGWFGLEPDADRACYWQQKASSSSLRNRD